MPLRCLTSSLGFKPSEDVNRALWQKRTSEEKKFIIEKLKSNEALRKENVKKALQTEEYRKNQSAVVRERYKKGFRIYRVSDHSLVGEYQNIVVAAKELNIHQANISACLHGRAKTFGFKKYYARFYESQSESY